MTFAELLTQIRNFYLDRLREAIQEARADPGVRIITEPVLRNAQGAVLHEGPLDLPMRVDVAVVVGSQVKDSFQVVTGQSVGFKPITFSWTGGTAITVRPFAWEACPFRLAGLGPEPNLKPLADWFLAWFDPNDERGLFYSDLQGVVHGLTDPVVGDGAASFTIDFGSAPPDIFEYLLDALEQLGAKTVQIGPVDEEGEKDGKEQGQP